jgi:predicted dehydrogenase
MGMKKVKTAILGMGKMGAIRYEAAQKHGGYEIVSICDVSQEAMDPYPGRHYTDAYRCIDETQPDAVIVCTVNRFIADLVCYALDNNIHVFSEKPPGRTLDETMRMSTHLQNSTALLKFGFNHRYHNSVIEAKTLIQHGLLGEVVCARGIYGKSGGIGFEDEWRNDPVISGGGILLDQGIHMLDLLCYFLGDFTSVKSSANQLYWKNTPTEDSVFAILKTADDRIASLHSSALQWKHKFDLDIICKGGYISLNGLRTATQSYGEETVTYYQQDLEQRSGKVGNPVEHTMVFDNDRSWIHEMCEFYDAVVKGIPPINGTIEDALRVMRLIDEIYRQ